MEQVYMVRTIDRHSRSVNNDGIVMNNRPHERYRKVFFDEDWLEDFVLKQLGCRKDLLYSISEFKNDRIKRGIVFYMLYRFSGMSATDIGRRYRRSDIAEQVRKVGATNLVDKWKVIDALRPYLPIKQFETYRMPDNNR